MSPFRPVEKEVMDHDSQAALLQLPRLNLAIMSSCPLPSKLQLSKGLYQKADWSIGSRLSAVWQELKVQKSPTGIEKFVTACVRKSLSQAIKAHERASALMAGSGPRCLINPNLPAFVLALSRTESWLHCWAAVVREVETEEGKDEWTTYICWMYPSLFRLSLNRYEKTNKRWRYTFYQIFKQVHIIVVHYYISIVFLDL